ncbi:MULTISPECIES: hypothetical protein [unclassified Bradyrhizobium]|uniref:hypothetical protein n=1 Tax=unclassified Bradyrhizobium TaxID=2631580 RepID=UPI002FF238CE
MTVLVRLLEKLTGRPHQHRHARWVANIASDLRRDISELQATLRPYAEAEEPLVALMTDIFNDRQMRSNGHDRTH